MIYKILKALPLYFVEKYELRRVPSPGLFIILLLFIPLPFNFGAGVVEDIRWDYSKKHKHHSGIIRFLFLQRAKVSLIFQIILWPS